MKNKWKRSVFILPLTGAIALSPATSVLAEEVELEKQDQAWTQAETTETDLSFAGIYNTLIAISLISPYL